MVTVPQESRIKIVSVWLVQTIEPLTVLVVGFMAVLAERLTQKTVLIGLALLLLPLLLRLFVLGQLTTPTLANVPLLLLLLLLVVTCWVTPSWRHTWPELVRMLWGMAVCLAVINQI